MGCWNKTCGITQFPIFAGDDVVAFILIKNSEVSTDTHPSYGTHTWAPIPLPLKAVYNDYGWIEHPDDTVSAKLAFLNEYFAKSLARKVPYEENGFIRYNNPKDSPFESLEALGNSIHGNLFGIKQPPIYGDNRIVSMSGFVIHRKVYDALTKGYSEFKYDYDEEKSKKFFVSKDDILHEVKLYRNWISELKKNDDLESQIKSRGEASVHYYTEEYPNIPRYLYGLLYFINSRWTMDTMLPVPICEAVNANAISDEELVEVWLLINSMSALRKSFYPQGYEGSQEGYTPIHDDLIKIQQELIEDYNSSVL